RTTRGGTTAGAAAPAASPLSFQHAQRDLGADAPRRGSRRPDAVAAERSASHRPRPAWPAGSRAQGRTRGAAEITRDRTGALRGPPDRRIWRRSRDTRRAGAELNPPATRR